MRGLFTAGVLDALFVGGIRFDGIVGVSAGACFGCNFKSHQPGRAIRYNRRFARDPRYCSWRSLLKTGDLFGAAFCYHEIPDRLDPFDKRMFARDPTAFYCVATDCRTGEGVYHRCDRADAETFEWIRASASMPLVSRPVACGDGLYLDGGLSDSLPFRRFAEMGYARQVVVTTRPRDYRKRASWTHALMRAMLAKMPAVAEAVRTRPARYNASLDELAEVERRGRVFVIAPDAPLPIARISHDPREMQRVYDIGLCAGRSRLAAVAEFLQTRRPA